MVFYLEDAHVTIRCEHASLCKIMYLVKEDDKVNNWLQDIHVIAQYIVFKHVRGRGSILADSLLRLKTSGLYGANDPNELGSEFGKSIFDTCSEIGSYANDNQHLNREFEVQDIKYLINENDLDDLPPQRKGEYSGDLMHLDMGKIKQLQQQDTHIADIATRCKPMKWDKTPYFLDECYIVFRKIKD